MKGQLEIRGKEVVVSYFKAYYGVAWWNKEDQKPLTN
jgi:hypothetical protein